MNVEDLRVYTVNEVAAKLRVDHNTVRRRIKAGELEGIKIGGSIRIPHDGFAAYLKRATAAAKTAEVTE